MYGNAFHRCERGATAVEFALILPPLLFIILGSIEMGLYLFTRSLLEGATYEASRLSKTGYVESELTQEETIRNTIEGQIDFFLDINDVTIESKSYANFASIGQPEPFIDADGDGIHDETENYTDTNLNGTYDEDMGEDGAGTSGEVVVYTVSYPWNVMNPLLHAYLGETMEIRSKFVVKNEPY